MGGWPILSRFLFAKGWFSRLLTPWDFDFHLGCANPPCTIFFHSPPHKYFQFLGLYAPTLEREPDGTIHAIEWPTTGRRE